MAEMESLFRSLTQAENTALFRVGLDGIVTHSYGDIIEQFLGRTEPFLGASFYTAFAKIRGPVAAIQKAVRGEAVSTTDWHHGRLLELQLYPERSETYKITGTLGIARDLTTASLTLGSKENQYLLDTVFENNQDGIMVIDENFVVRRVNKSFRSWLPEVIPNECTCYGTLVGIDKPCSFCPCEKTFQTGQRHECIYYNPKYDKWYELTSFPVMNQETGKTNLVIEYVRDIDEKYRREKYIEHQRKLLDTILEASHDGILAVTEDNETPHANAAFIEMFDFWEQLRYQQSPAVLHALFDAVLVDADTLIDLVRQTRETGGHRNGVIHFRDGRVCDIGVRTVDTELEGSTLCRIWTCRDVTQQVENERTLLDYRDRLEKMVEERTQELMRKESQMRVLLSNSNSPIFFVDTDFRFTFVNTMFCEMTGYAEHELIDEPVMIIYNVDSPCLAALQGLRNRLLAGEIDNYRIEISIRTKQGGICWVDMNAAAVRDENGKIEQIIAVFLDITEKRKILDELEAARVAAIDASNAKSQFLATMSHEIRTPLNGVIGLSDLLLGTALNPKQHEYAQLINDSGKTLLFIINDILDFSKIEAGKLEIDLEEFNLVATVESVLGILSSRAEAKRIELCATFAYGMPCHVEGDSGRIRQVLVNLVGNAVKFTETGGVHIELLQEKWDGNILWVRFNIKDTGIGIAPDRMNRLFKQFSQADSSSARIYGGTGLGLAISMKLVHLMGGEIGVESKPGVGSNFWFTLPFACHPTKAQCIQGNTRNCYVQRLNCCLATGLETCIGVTHSGLTKGLDIKGRPLLFVDDNISQRAAMEEQFKVWGFDTVVCKSKIEATRQLMKALAAEKPFEILVVDSSLADGPGRELIIVAETLPEDKRPKIIYFSPLACDQDDDAVRNAGITTLTKPIFSSTLFTMIAKLLFDGETDAAKELPQTVRPEERSLKSPLAGKIRVLVAEDNRINQIVAKNMLEEAGFESSIASNGVEVFNEACKGEFDVILMDCQMPEMDGYEATDQIRKWELEHGKKRIPIIALTANATKEDEQKCLNAGMDAFCVKPINPANVIRLIEEWCKSAGK